MLLMAPIVALYDPATEESVSFGVSGENAAKVTSSVSGGGVQYARLKVASPTEDNDAATKKYVDDHSSAGEKYLVESTAISKGEYDAARKMTNYYLTFNKTNNEIIAALNSGKDIQFKVTLTEGNDSYTTYFSVGYTRVDVFANVPAYMFVGSFGELDHSVITVYGVTDSDETFRPYLTTTGGILPEPNPDDSDDGKSLVVNKHKWEIKKVDAITDVATVSTNGLMSAKDKEKLNGIEDGANKTVVDAALDAASTNPVQNKAVKEALDGKAGKDVATESINGLMSASDKEKLNGIAKGATRTTVDGLLLDNSDNPVSNRVLKAALDAKAYKTIATAEADGLMSKDDKAKLDGIEEFANKTVVDEALDASSTNPVQNKAVKAALDTKAGTAVASTSANGLMSKDDKAKLDDVEAGANKTIVDAALDAASENPVQNKIVKAALDGKLSTRGGEISASLRVGQTVSAEGSVSVGRTTADTGIHFEKAASDAGRISHGSDPMTGVSPIARLKVADPTEDDDAATKKYVDDRTVRYDAAQGLTSDQKFRACQNIGAVNQKYAFINGAVTLQATGHDDGVSVVNITPIEKSNDYTLTLDAGPENVPVYVAGLETPTDVQTDYAANVAFVKAKIAEVAASGDVDVDNALSATSTNPVQNKVITSALAGKADKTALDAKADKTALDGKLDKTGGTLTGNLTGKYFTGTWLQTTAATDLGRKPPKVAVLDESGWVYYRTPAEILNDIGGGTGGAGGTANAVLYTA